MNQFYSTRFAAAQARLLFLVLFPAFVHAQFTISLTKTDVSCFGLADGTATVSANGGTAPFSYFWSNGGDQATLTGLGPGTYTVSVSDATGFATFAAITITQPAQLGVTAFAISQICEIAPDGSATAVPYGGTPPYAYLWSNGGNTASIDNLQGGTYTVTVSDAHGCSATSTTTVLFFNEGLWLMMQTTGVSCPPGSMDGTVEVSAFSGTAPYHYLWSTGDTTQALAGLGPGSYTVTVTDANGCSNSTTTQVTALGNLLVSALIANPSCPTPSNGQISLSPFPGSGIPPFSYLWSTGDTISTLSGLVAGTYGVTVTDANGCQFGNDFELSALQQPIQFVQIAGPLCNEVALEFSAAAGYDHYEWAVGDSIAGLILSGQGTGEVSALWHTPGGHHITVAYYDDGSDCINSVVYEFVVEDCTGVQDSCQNCPIFMPDGFFGSVGIKVSCAANDDLADPMQGLCAVQLQFEHEYLGDLTMTLTSPAGQSVQLVGPFGFFGQTDLTQWDVAFTRCADAASPDPGFTANWNNNQPWGMQNNYSGTYYPALGCLEDFDTGPVNGQWTLTVVDGQAVDVGILYDAALFFCDNTRHDSCGGQNPALLAVDFTTSIEGDSVYCFSQIANATGFLWTFNNNDFSIYPDPVFELPGPGSYPLSLQAWNATDTLTKTVTIVVNSVATAVAVPVSCSVAPNPFDRFLRVECPTLPQSPAQVQLLDAYGRVLRSGMPNGAGLTFDTGDLATGVYFLRINAAGNNAVRKVVKSQP